MDRARQDKGRLASLDSRDRRRVDRLLAELVLAELGQLPGEQV